MLRFARRSHERQAILSDDILSFFGRQDGGCAFRHRLHHDQEHIRKEGGQRCGVRGSGDHQIQHPDSRFDIGS